MPDNVSGSEQEDALAQQTEIKDEIEAVHRQHDEGEGEFQVGVSCQREIGAGVISLQRRKQYRRSEQSTLESQTADLEQQSDQSTCERHVVVSWTTRGHFCQQVGRKFNDRGEERD